jgi:IclR family transcriptional regulator, acetate operon repressor
MFREPPLLSKWAPDDLRGAALNYDVVAMPLQGDLVGDEAVDRLSHVGLPRAAAELAVHEDVEADLTLTVEHLEDRSVLSLPKARARGRALTRFTELGRSQQAPDLIGSVLVTHGGAAPLLLGANHGWILVSRQSFCYTEFMSDVRRRPTYPIESVDKALQLLLAFRHSSSLRVAEVADRLCVARSTAHRLLAMLEYREFIEQDPATRAYVAGPALEDTGLAVVARMEGRRIARPIIERLSEKLGETVHFGVLRGTEVLFVDGFESTRALRAGNRVGVRLPAHCTAAGKAMLAQLSLEDLRHLLPERLEPRTARSLVRRMDLERELEQVRDRGYATNFGESEDDLVALAAAVTGGCIVVTAPATRAEVKSWAKLVAPPTLAAAGEISALLEGCMPGAEDRATS